MKLTDVKVGGTVVWKYTAHYMEQGGEYTEERQKTGIILKIIEKDYKCLVEFGDGERRWISTAFLKEG